jgi:glycosyltransferase involved in cell wall biosynthesis
MPGLFIERHARSVARHADVSLLYVHPDDRIREKAEVEIVRDEELLQVRIYFRRAKCWLAGLQPLLNTLRYLKYHWKGLRIIRKEAGKPDILHVNVLTRLGVIALIYKWLTGKPYVITEHWTRYLPQMDNYRGRLRKAMTRLVVRQASAVMPVTENLRRAMESKGLKNHRYRIIPNVVDVEMFRPGAEHRTPRGKIHILHVSCFEDRQKNISGILRVLDHIGKYRSDWECHMVGEGIHFDHLKGEARRMGLGPDRVIFHGLKENEELAALMASADFQLLFSRFENLPVVILESYSCGVPVLSTDVGGIREHLNEDLGILIASENEEELERQINHMMDHYPDFSKEKIRAYACDHFSREVIGRQLYSVYREVLDS